MAKAKTINDIEAQIEALKKEKQAIIAKQKEEEKKLIPERQRKIGAAVESVLGKIDDIDSFKSQLKALKEQGAFDKKAKEDPLAEENSTTSPESPKKGDAEKEEPITFS